MIEDNRNLDAEEVHDDNNVQVVEKPIKRSKTFKERYQDPEYKEKHKQYVNQKIECDCGKSVTRAGLALHKRSRIHQKRLDEKKNNDETELLKRILELGSKNKSSQKIAQELLKKYVNKK